MNIVLTEEALAHLMERSAEIGSQKVMAEGHHLTLFVSEFIWLKLIPAMALHAYMRSGRSSTQIQLRRATHLTLDTVKR